MKHPPLRMPRVRAPRGQELVEYAVVTAFAVVGLAGVLVSFEDVLTRLYRTSASLVTMEFP